MPELAPTAANPRWTQVAEEPTLRGAGRRASAVFSPAK